MLALTAPRIIDRLTRSSAAQRWIAMQSLNSLLVDSLQGLPTLKAFNQARARGEELASRIKNLLKSTTKMLGPNITAWMSTQMLVNTGAAIALGYGVVQVIQGTMSFDVLIILLLLSAEICKPVIQLAQYYHNTTIMDNIRIGKQGATNAEVIEAAKKAYMHDFIIKLPQGYDTLLGEHGAKLSGGQRQLISIARALLKDAPILILDEATSNLDSHSEQLIRNGITTLMEGRTTLIIAHRLSTIATADGVIVLDRGQVIETGTHTNLINKKGTYSRIVASQREITI
jgi:ABC-type multidrug transport system fused ATPase/permease subunit